MSLPHSFFLWLANPQLPAWHSCRRVHSRDDPETPVLRRTRQRSPLTRRSCRGPAGKTSQWPYRCRTRTSIRPSAAGDRLKPLSYPPKRNNAYGLGYAPRIRSKTSSVNAKGEDCVMQLCNVPFSYRHHTPRVRIRLSTRIRFALANSRLASANASSLHRRWSSLRA